MRKLLHVNGLRSYLPMKATSQGVEELELTYMQTNGC